MIRMLWIITIFVLSLLSTSLDDGAIIGAKEKPTYTAPRTKETTVFITRTGSRYHAAGCRYLRKSSEAIGIGRAKEQYQACTVCGAGK